MTDEELHRKMREIAVMLDEYEAAIIAAERWYSEWKARQGNHHGGSIGDQTQRNSPEVSGGQDSAGEATLAH
jgi:hypothetical protein